ncbi:MAG: 6-carboxytetrahydropterin synthase QueD [Myxococcota bacterium]
MSKTFRFEAAHFLPHVPPDHPCGRLHGHGYQVTIHVQGPVDPRMGWVVDFTCLEQAFAPLRDQLDHTCLNDVVGLENPTSENLALFILHRLQIDGARLVSVTVSETCTCRCTVYAPGGIMNDEL